MVRKIIADTKGVSIIVGAMLLIVIVVVGAVAVAQLVSNLQEQAAEKASYKSAVEREELEVLKISLYDGATIDDFEGVYEIIKGKEGTEIGYRIEVIPTMAGLTQLTRWMWSMVIDRERARREATHSVLMAAAV